MLDISKIEAGKLHLTIEEFDIRQTVDEVIDLIAHANVTHQIELQTSVSSLKIIGDAHRVEQVIINLLTNAIRYAPGNFHIQVFLDQDADNVRIGVKDNGVGIPPDKIRDIFSRFYRVDDANPNISGLGIGLYLCHEIVSRHNGKIWVESEMQKGSTFWFALPVGKSKSFKTD